MNKNQASEKLLSELAKGEKSASHNGYIDISIVENMLKEQPVSPNPIKNCKRNNQ